MGSPASIKNHPLHPMLVAIPIGLWVFSFVSDIIALSSMNPALWSMVSYYTMIGGVVGALLAAVPGFIDFLSITDRRTRAIGLKHLVTNLTIVVLYVINIVIRGNNPLVSAGPFVLSLVSICALLYSGWLGGNLVYEQGMAVQLDADGKLEGGRPRPYVVPVAHSHTGTSPRRTMP